VEKENLFNEPKLLKNWAIKLANELGGQKVKKLIDQFVIDHNTNMVRVMNEEEE